MPNYIFKKNTQSNYIVVSKNPIIVESKEVTENGIDLSIIIEFTVDAILMGSNSVCAVEIILSNSRRGISKPGTSSALNPKKFTQDILTAGLNTRKRLLTEDYKEGSSEFSTGFREIISMNFSESKKFNLSNKGFEKGDNSPSYTYEVRARKTGNEVSQDQPVLDLYNAEGFPWRIDDLTLYRPQLSAQMAVDPDSITNREKSSNCDYGKDLFALTGRDPTSPREAAFKALSGGSSGIPEDPAELQKIKNIPIKTSWDFLNGYCSKVDKTIINRENLLDQIKKGIYRLPPHGSYKNNDNAAKVGPGNIISEIVKVPRQHIKFQKKIKIGLGSEESSPSSTVVGFSSAQKKADYLKKGYLKQFNKIFLEFNVHQATGKQGESKVIQTVFREVNLSSKISDADIPVSPPTISACDAQKDYVQVEVNQTDPNASTVKLFARYLSFQVSPDTGMGAYTEIGKFDLKKAEGPRSIRYYPQSPGPIIYRAIAGSGKTFSSACSGDVKSIGITRDGDKNFIVATIVPIITRNGIQLRVFGVQPDVRVVSIMRRNVTTGSPMEMATDKGGQALTEISDFGKPLIFIDDNVFDEETYEYRCLLQYEKGDTIISPTPTIKKYVSLKGKIAVSLSIPKIRNGRRKNDIGVVILPTVREKSQDDNLALLNLLKKGKFSGLKEAQKNLEQDSQDIHAFHVLRYDTFTGTMDDLGIFPATKAMVDTGNLEVNPPPRRGIKYIYVFKLLSFSPYHVIEMQKRSQPWRQSKKSLGNVRDALRGLNDIRLSADSNTAVTRVQMETGIGVSRMQNIKIGNQLVDLDALNPNFQAKFSSVITAGFGKNSGTLVYGEAAAEKFDSELLLHETGIENTVEVYVPTTWPKIKKATSLMITRGHVKIQWTIDSPSLAHLVDHFIVQVTRFLGSERISYCTTVAHGSAHQRGKYVVIDTESSKNAGIVEYAIIPVYLNFNRGPSQSAGSILITRVGEEIIVRDGEGC